MASRKVRFRGNPAAVDRVVQELEVECSGRLLQRRDLPNGLVEAEMRATDFNLHGTPLTPGRYLDRHDIGLKKTLSYFTER